MATGVLRLRLRAYYDYGYGRTTTMATGVLRLWLRAYYDYGYGRTTTTATGVLRLRLRANVRAYYVNFFTAYTVCYNVQISRVSLFRYLGEKQSDRRAFTQEVQNSWVNK